MNKRSNGNFAIGEDAYRKKLAADEMIETPLDQLLAIAEKDLRKNQTAFADAARVIDPTRTPRQVLDSVEADHPPAATLLETTQAGLDAIGRFMEEHHIVTVPNAAPARVQETPPFMRSTTTASMDIPGPFETVSTEAYSLTHDAAGREAVRRRRRPGRVVAQWNYPLISNVSNHGVWPGHYLQFLYSRNLPLDVCVFRRQHQQRGPGASLREEMVTTRDFMRTIPALSPVAACDARCSATCAYCVGIRMQ